MSLRRGSDKKRIWRPAVIVICFVFAIVLAVCLIVPRFVREEEYSDIYSINHAKWIPEESLDFFPADSLGGKSANYEPAVYFRYDESCPKTLKLMILTVRPDGTQKRDSVNVALLDAYGKAEGKKGQVLSEQKIVIGWHGDPTLCRMIEIFPADTVTGIHEVGMTVVPKNL